MSIELALLSQVRYRDVEITGARLRNLLALLAADLRAGCSSGRLVSSLWPEELPEHPAKALQTLVSRARARLGPETIATTATGYRLALDPAQVDASAVLLRAAAAERHAGRGDHSAALDQAEAGLALYAPGAASTPDAEVADGGAHDLPGVRFQPEVGGAVTADGPLAALRVARADTHRALRRSRALALSRLDRPAEAIETLTGLVADRPRDEEALRELLRCLAATQGPAAALARYESYRRELRAELGADPGPALREAHRELLAGDAPAVRRGLRHEPNELLGRDPDIAAVLDLLRTARVVSIVGPGGLGKTRLAQAVGRRAAYRVVQVVELAGVTLDGDVLDEVAAALGVALGAGRAAAGQAPEPAGNDAGHRGRLVAAAVDALGAGPALLVLDNCEHVLAGVADLVRELVSRSAHLRVLTTSRAPLGLSSESVHPLPELDLPNTVELFTRRATAARPGARLPPDAVRELCARLDGLPLAVELAAARIRVMSATEIARRLDDRFALLRDGPRDAPSRHRTLHAVIDWSWHLLDPAGRAAMRALSVFPGGFTADAVRRMTGDDAVLTQLVEQSLLKVSDDADGARFRMLETVREFSVARRDEAGETAAVIDRFLAWARDLDAGTDLFPAVEAIRAEQDNLVRALRYGLDRSDGASVAATAALLGTLWLIDSNFTRLLTLADEVPAVLARFRPGTDDVEATRAAAVWCALIAYLARGPRPLRALAVLRRLPPPPADTVVGAAHLVLGAPDARALRELCDSEPPLLASVANYAYSYVAENAGDLDLALRAARRMLARVAGANPWLWALAEARIGELCLQVDPGEEAFRHIGAALSLMEELGARSSASRARWAIVLADLQRGAYDRAERGLEQLTGDSLSQEVGHRMFEVCIRAEIRLGRGDIEAGLRLWRQATAGLPAAGAAPADRLWACEMHAAAVVAHWGHGRLGRVADLADALPVLLSTVVPGAAAVQFRVCGALLAALGLVELERGATARGARTVALAQRFGISATFQPTMSAARLGAAAERGDPRAYRAALAAGAGLDHDGLRAAALALLDGRAADAGAEPAPPPPDPAVTEPRLPAPGH